MATAAEILPLSVMKDELRIDASIIEHDALLFHQIEAAVNFVDLLTDFGVADKDVADVPDVFRQAVIVVTRRFYDGNDTWFSQFSLYQLVRPLLKLTVVTVDADT